MMTAETSLTAPQSQTEAGSFRDRDNRVFYQQGTVYRALSQDALDAWNRLEATRLFGKFIESGKLVRTELVQDNAIIDPALAEGWAGFLQHDTIPFISYPYEWCFSQLKDAALLQLELLLASLDENMTMKDASAFNVQWNGATPSFIDICSLKPLEANEPWAGYRQFCQMHLYPLMLQAYKDVPYHTWYRGSINGFDAEQFNNLMSLGDRFRPGVLMHVYMQAKLQSHYANRNVKSTVSQAGFHKELIVNNVRQLHKLVKGLTWKAAGSEWADYTTNNSYTDQDAQDKIDFITAVSQERHRTLVWDLGCNTGTFSRIAAENSDYVVAMDLDHLAIEKLYHSLKANGPGNILPLVNNLVEPSPNLGWRGLERKALPDRRKPELVLCLALIHHIVISGNVPVSEFIDWLASLNADLVIEFVTKDDPMVKKLLQNKKDNYHDYEVPYFEHVMGRYFDIQKRQQINEDTRILYYATPKQA